MVKWNVSGDWVLTQSDGRTVEIKLVQGTDGTLGGSGDFVDLPRDGWPTNPSRDRSSPKGLTGKVTDDGFSLEIDWVWSVSGQL